MLLLVATLGARVGELRRGLLAALGVLLVVAAGCLGAFTLLVGNAADYNPTYLRVGGAVTLLWALVLLLGCVLSRRGRRPQRWLWPAGLAALMALLVYPLAILLEQRSLGTAWAQADGKEDSLWFLVLAVTFAGCALGSARPRLSGWLLAAGVAVASVLIASGLFPPPR